MPEFIQAWDLSFLSWTRTNHDPAIVWLAWALSTIAWKGWLWWLVIGFSWLKGRREFAAAVAMAILIATVAGLPLKSLIARPRPDLYASMQLNIPMPELLTTTHSFPSGHTLLAAALAFVVLRFFPGWPALAAFAFVCLVGLARIYQGMHWPTDIIGSIALGGLCALAALKVCQLPLITRFTRRQSKPLALKAQLLPPAPPANQAAAAPANDPFIKDIARVK